MPASPLRHQQIEVAGISIHVVEGGMTDAPAVFFLHSWPEDWSEFEQVMLRLHDRAHVVAIDLPGIGGSPTPPAANDKRTLASYVKAVIDRLGLQDVTLVGHDCGGMIAYAFLRAYPDVLRRAIIMDVVIPGVPPWEAVLRNPYIWHFAFHTIPDLPETLVHGKEAIYFAFFYDTIAAKPEAISAAQRQRYVAAYRSPTALHTGFEWYRAFAQDAKENAAEKGTVLEMPVLYVRGDHESGKIQDYLDGFRSHGLTNVTGHVIEACGHFSAEEQPEAVAHLIADAIQNEVR